MPGACPDSSGTGHKSAIIGTFAGTCPASMFDLFHGLDLWVGLSLVLALTFVLAFEFINGFHDTANAVATVIYTRPCRRTWRWCCRGSSFSRRAAAWAWLCHRPPAAGRTADQRGYRTRPGHGVRHAGRRHRLEPGHLVLRHPASSSHTLIGSILGVGLANALITDLPLGDGVNWGKAIDIGLSLVVSPVAGFLIAGGLLLALAGYRCRRCTRRPSNGANWTTRSTRRSGTAWCWCCRRWA